MTETLYLIIGIVLLLLVIIDFFYTTLSASGVGYLTKTVLSFAHRFIQLVVRFFGRGTYRFSGMIVNLLVLAIWIFVVWIGLFLVFSSNPGAVVDSDGGVANSWERLYYTGYTLSTLGMGDFNPTTPAFQILTSCFSFFGFIFFTSSMTYLISVSSAIIAKRTLARTIQNLGKNPEKIAEKFLELDTSYSYQQIMSIQEMLDNHVVNLQAYPVLHYYSHPKAKVSLSINFTRLDEAVSILLASDKADYLHSELAPLRESLTHFLDHINENYSRKYFRQKQPPTSLPLPYEIRGANKDELQRRRRILGGFLKSESYNWEDVYPNS